MITEYEKKNKLGRYVLSKSIYIVQTKNKSTQM